MGSIWLSDLPDVVDATGLDWRLWPGWETRGRSSGGYDQTWAVFAHHTASSAAPDDDAGYMWDRAEDRPIGAVLLERSGRVTIGAAGATNTQGKGGPWTLSRGTIPLDKGNAYGIAVEAANNGVGEAWPQVQTDAYVILVDALCDYRGLDPARDVLAHFEWCQPSCAGRKVDPVGPSPYAAGAQSWDMNHFRRDIAGWPEPEPEPQPPSQEDDDVTRLYLAKLDTNPNHVRRGDGNIATILRANEVNSLKARMDRGDPGRAGQQTYYDPLTDEPIIGWGDIPACNEGQLDLDVGYILATSQTSADEG
jgi:N-acetylmuramoyl-L-alanine amidase